MQAATNPTLRRNAAQHRFEIEADGEVAGFIEYRDEPDAVHIVHTEVKPAFEGRGLAAQLARFALDEVRRDGRKAAVSCSYVARWIEKHPEYADLLA